MTTDAWLLISLYFAGPVKRRDPSSWSHVVGSARAVFRRALETHGVPVDAANEGR